MTLLALDTSSTLTGWAARSDCGTVSYGRLDMREGIPIRGRHPGLILLRAHAQIGTLIDQHRPRAVIFEQPIVRGSGTRILWSIAGIVELAAAERGLPTGELGVSKWRAALLGAGNAPKEASTAWALANGYAPEDDNVADALCILHAWLLLEERAEAARRVDEKRAAARAATRAARRLPRGCRMAAQSAA